MFLMSYIAKHLVHRTRASDSFGFSMIVPSDVRFSAVKTESYNILAFLEALLIKHNKAFLNTGLKTNKELQLFT